MDQVRFFESVIEPSTERLSLFGISHDINFDRRNFVVSHKVSKNVFTSFDARLSRYLAAVRGEGLPQGTVETRIRDVATGRAWTPYPARYCASMPAALATAAKLALGSNPEVSVRLGAWVSPEGGLDNERVLTTETIAALDQALSICARIGTVDFLEISGDLDRVLVRPAESDLDTMILDLQQGTVSVPPVTASGTGHKGPLFGFAEAVRTVPAVGSYLSRARHAVAIAKEQAIHEFRDAAEERINQFNAALAGRPLTGYRLEAASSLVARLQAGLGTSLVGLSEAAQMTALDWATLMRGGGHTSVLSEDDDDEDNGGQHPRLVG